jgi:hypothetical protein
MPRSTHPKLDFDADALRSSGPVPLEQRKLPPDKPADPLEMLPLLGFSSTRLGVLTSLMALLPKCTNPAYPRDLVPD